MLWSKRNIWCLAIIFVTYFAALGVNTAFALNVNGCTALANMSTPIMLAPGQTQVLDAGAFVSWSFWSTDRIIANWPEGGQVTLDVNNVYTGSLQWEALAEGTVDEGIGQDGFYKFTFKNTDNINATITISCSGNMGLLRMIGDTHDFDGIHISNILWRCICGDVGKWSLSGFVPAKYPAPNITATDLGNVPTNWSIVGQRNFGVTGTSSILWRDNSGNLALWYMNGSAISASTEFGNVPATWTVAGTCTEGDLTGQILWRDTSGNVAIWLMNGAQVSSSVSVGNVPTTWTVAGTGDFIGDGNCDILWRDTSGDTAIWLMNGAQVSSSVSVGNVPTTWTVAGTGDFDGDDKSDILWRDTSGDVAIWLMNGGQVSSAAFVGNVPTTWSIAQTGDYDGDGKSDILWSDTSGDMAIWLMNGGQVSSSQSIGNVPTTTWTVQSINAD